MRWLLLTDELNSISKKCIDFLQVAGQTVLIHSREGIRSKQEIKDFLTNEKPDRIIIFINENHTAKLPKNLHDYLLIPLFVAQLTTQSFSPIPILLLTSTTENKDLNILQNALDQLIQMYPHILNAKLFSPIDDENINEKYFQSIWGENPDEFHHITILSDILPIVLALIHDGTAHGQIDVCNKGMISLNSFQKMKFKQPQSIEIEDIPDKFETLNKQMIAPETRQIYQASYLLPTIYKSIEQILQQKILNTNPNSPKILLVTGGCGFIGSTFINHWLETYPNDQIINIDRLDPVANIKNITKPKSPNYSFILADIRNKDIILHLCNQYNITHIVHFAGKERIENKF